jgi:hypothetical protein
MSVFRKGQKAFLEVVVLKVSENKTTFKEEVIVKFGNDILAKFDADEVISLDDYLGIVKNYKPSRDLHTYVDEIQSGEGSVNDWEQHHGYL